MTLFEREIPDDVEDVEWRTDMVAWDDLLQVKENYVVHARMFIVDGDVWLDHYNVMNGHDSWWYQDLESEYYQKEWRNDNVVALELTGDPNIIITHPNYSDIDGERICYIAQALMQMDVPGATPLFWSDEDRGRTVEEVYYASNN